MKLFRSQEFNEHISLIPPPSFNARHLTVGGNKGHTQTGSPLALF